MPAQPVTVTPPDPAKPKRKQPAHLGTHGHKWETKDPWDQIRAAVEAGTPIYKAAKRYNVPYERAKKRCQREKWVVPSTAIALARERARKLGIEVPTVSLKDVPKPSESSPEASEKRVELGTFLLQNAAELAESSSHIGLSLVHGLLSDAQKRPQALFPLESVQDLASAVKLARMAGNLDKQTTGVVLNLWGSPTQHTTQLPRELGDVLDVEEVEA